MTRVADALDGRFAVVWSNHDNVQEWTGGLNQPVVMLQHFNINGVPTTAQVVVPSSGDPWSDEPAISMAWDGTFVVAWKGVGGGPDDIGDVGIQIRMYDANAVPLGDHYHANALEDAYYYTPEIAIKPGMSDKSFVVVWAEYIMNQSNLNRQIFAQRFNGSGVKVGATNFQVNTYSTSVYTASYPDVDMADDGRFVVVWQGYSDESDYGVFGRRFDANGNAQGSDFQVNTTWVNMQERPRVAVAPNGNFVVVWQSYGTDGSGYGVYGQRYNAAGVKQGGEFLVNQHTQNYQNYPDVACDRSGNFTVIWQSYNNPDDPITQDYGIIARQYYANGTPASDEYVVNNPYLLHRGIGNQLSPAVSRRNGSGKWVAAWCGLRGISPDGGVQNVWHSQVNGSPLPSIVWSLWSPTSGTFGQGTVLTGDWTGRHSTSAGFYEPTSSCFFLRNSNTTGTTDIGLNYGPGNWKAVAGDWTNKGYDSVGLYSPSTATFYLKNSNTTGISDITFGFGAAGNTMVPIVGDWTNKGYDSVGLYDPATSAFYLRNSNTAGAADITFIFGTPGAGWLPIVGDWNGDGNDTIGLYDPATSTFHLRNSNSAGGDDVTFVYGTPGSWKPIAGDWTDKGYDTIGLYDYSTATFHLRNSNSAGSDDISYVYRCAIRVGWDGYGMQSGYTVCLCVTPGLDFTNARWISIGAIPAVNGQSLWYWDRCDTNGTPIPAGTWYIAGYVWNGSTATYNHASSAFVIS